MHFRATVARRAHNPEEMVQFHYMQNDKKFMIRWFFFKYFLNSFFISPTTVNIQLFLAKGLAKLGFNTVLLAFFDALLPKLNRKILFFLDKVEVFLGQGPASTALFILTLGSLAIIEHFIAYDLFFTGGQGTLYLFNLLFEYFDFLKSLLSNSSSEAPVLSYPPETEENLFIAPESHEKFCIAEDSKNNLEKKREEGEEAVSSMTISVLYGVSLFTAQILILFFIK